MTRQEIAKATKSNGGTLTKRLENLERCDFITGSQIIGNTKKGTIYRMVDFFTLFYYKFVDGTKRRNIPYWVTLSNSRSVQSWFIQNKSYKNSEYLESTPTYVHGVAAIIRKEGQMALKHCQKQKSRKLK